MNRSKAGKRSRPRAKCKRVKKVTAGVANSQTNTAHSNTYGHWVSEMAKMAQETKSLAGPLFKRPSL